MGPSRRKRGCASGVRRHLFAPRAGGGTAGVIFCLVLALSPAAAAAHAHTAAADVARMGKSDFLLVAPASTPKSDPLKPPLALSAPASGAVKAEPAGAPAEPPGGPPADPALSGGAGTPYYLEVFINGQPTRLIGEFLRRGDGSFACRARELKELGITPPAGAGPEEPVALEDLGAKARYEEATQRIFITLDDSARVRKTYDLRAGAEAGEVRRADTGMVLNYSLLASARTNGAFASSSFEGASANLEGWIYSPLGTVSSAGFVRLDGFRSAKFVRLESSWRYTDVRRAISYRVGDLITSGPNWARPVRLGGVSVTRNFRVRPDIVTMPLPSLSGTAAVPTTVDVYLNNVRVHTQQVDPGPFTITNIPAISSAGVARLVMRDAAGRETEIRQSFYASSRLLRTGLLEFSLAAGAPRLEYGVKSFRYGHSPGGAASVRYGVSDTITAHAHAEAAKDLQLAGGGFTAALFDRALITAAGAFSHNAGKTGFLVYGALETRLGDFTLNASTQRVFGHYADLASVTAPSPGAGGSVYTALDFPRALDSVSLGYALPNLGGGVSLNFLHAKSRSQGSSNTLSLSYNQRLFGNVSFYVTAFADVKRLDRPNIFAGITIPLGGGESSASAGFSYDESGKYRATASYSKPLKQKNGSVGWRARVSLGDLRSAQASLAWRTSKATVRGTVMRMNDNTLGHVTVDGAMVLAGGGLFAANRINDSFAVVKAGAPGVTVRYENRPVGKTDRSGRLLVPTLRSFQRNKISIDPETLPVDATVADSKIFVAPADRAGVTVDFGVRPHSAAALVTFVDAAGKPLEVGGEARLEGAAGAFVVGYDGQTWLEGLKAHNRVRIDSGEGKVCEAAFDFTPKPGEQVAIGPVKCLPAADAERQAALGPEPRRDGSP